MGIDEIKRWQWAIIGAVVGLMLGYAWTSMGSDAGPANIHRVDQREFERDLTLRDEQSGQPFIKDIVIRPPEPSFDGPVTVVDFHRLARDRQGRIGWVDRQVIAKTPFKPVVPGRVEKLDSNLTIEGYLASVRKELDVPVSFQSAWWLQPQYAMMLGALVGAAVIGGVWPTLLGVMIGAGIGPKKREPKLKDRKLPRLNWFKRADSGSRPGAAQPTMNSAALGQAQNVADAYEQNLAAGAVARTDMPTELIPKGADIKKLQGGPAEAAALVKQDEDEIEVKSKEFYPVIIHHHKPKPDPNTAGVETPPNRSGQGH